uniref:Uncharacterized protein n=1 Tax=Romanomermis culicivorax TaxID=13658 RepID=A0A915JBU0_ROMCU
MPILTLALFEKPSLLRSMTLPSVPNLVDFRIFTSMLGKKASLKPLKRKLHEAKLKVTRNLLLRTSETIVAYLSNAGPPEPPCSHVCGPVATFVVQ